LTAVLQNWHVRGVAIGGSADYEDNQSIYPNILVPNNAKCKMLTSLHL
jgi:hypothetical protein